MEKETYIITSGWPYVDIDAYACICAYKELLTLKKDEAHAIITSKINFSITPRYQNLPFYTSDTKILDEITDPSFIMMDVSDYEHFEHFVNVDRVTRIFDHHGGFEKFWSDKIGKNAVIEPLGAAATLIVREYEKYGLLDQISPEIAELLAVAIISNSLNFQAKITKEEDHLAYKKLQKHFDYTDDFAEKYFIEVQETVEGNIEKALRDDEKVINKDLYISQLEVWNADHVFSHLRPEIMRYLEGGKEPVAFVNIIDLSKNGNVIQCRDSESLQWMQKHFPEFSYDTEKNIAITDHVMLRKEILVRIQ